MKFRLASIRFIIIAVSAVSVTAQEPPVPDDETHVVHFEQLAYPLTARLTRVQGTVVVRLKLDDQGKVTAVSAVSGAKSLLSECLINAKKWVFRPNATKSIVLLYNFKIEGLCELPCASQFSFHPPNMAKITIGVPVVDHSAQ